jgi:hypothetical protein
MDIARSVTEMVDEMRLRQAREEVYRARLEFLRADLLDGNCDVPARHVRAAEARARQIETELAGRRTTN